MLMQEAFNYGEEFSLHNQLFSLMPMSLRATIIMILENIESRPKKKIIKQQMLLT
jgi:hypothetical protein